MRALVSGATVALLVLLPATAAATNGDGAAVTGEVFLDLDGDGTRDPGEPGRASVQLTLRTEAAILDATVTATDGSWTFNNVPAGTLTLVVEPPNDLAVTGGSVAGLDAAAGEATVDVDGDVDLGTIGLGTPLASGTDAAVTVTVDEAASTDDRYRWDLTALNLGGVAAPGPVELRAVLSSGHEVVDAAGDGWSCEPSSAIVLCTTTSDLAAGSTLPTLTVTTGPVGDVGTRVTVTGTVRLDGAFDGAPLNDEDVASWTIGTELAAEDLDGDGTGDLTNAGAAVSGLLVAALLALVVGAAAVTTSRRSHRP